jgi:ABC-type glycerol-3-phosphate transport system permease component
METKHMRKRLKRRKYTGLLTYAFLIAFSIFILFPVAWMFVTSFKTVEDTFSVPPRWLPTKISVQAYIDIWVKYPMSYYFRNSVIVVIFSTIISVSVSCLAGYAASRSTSRLKKPFLTFLLVLQMFPAIMLLIPYYKMLAALKFIDTLQGLILPNIAFTMPFCTWMMMGYFNTIPRELEQAAMIDGCTRSQYFTRVILPLSLPGISATVIYSFINVWNEYMFSLTLQTSEKMKTLTVGVGQMAGEYRTMWNEMMAADILASLPLIIAFMFFQKYFISTLTAGAVKG